MTTVSITITTLDGSDVPTWAQALDAIDYCTPVTTSLSLASAWSGDVDTVRHGMRVQVAVREGSEPVPVIDAHTDALDTLDDMIEALDEVRDAYTRMRLQESILADADKVGDHDQAAFSRDRIAMHTANLTSAQARLEAATVAHKEATRL